MEGFTLGSLLLLGGSFYLSRLNKACVSPEEARGIPEPEPEVIPEPEPLPEPIPLVERMVCSRGKTPVTTRTRSSQHNKVTPHPSLWLWILYRNPMVLSSDGGVTWFSSGELCISLRD